MNQLDATRTEDRLAPSNPHPALPLCEREGSGGSGAALDDPRVVAALEEYAEALRQGQKPHRRKFLARYPDLAEALSECLEGLEMIHGAVGELESQTTASTEEPLSGTLGDYRLIAEIGRGGMGIVYEAEQISLGRKVALKVLPFAATMDKRQLQRFLNEARAAAWLRHAHIVPVYAVGCTRGVNYYAMQMIDGQSLETLLQTMRANLRQATHSGTDSPSAQPPKRAKLPAKSGDTVREPRAQNTTLTSSKRGRADWRRIAELAVQAAEALEHAHQSGVVHRDVKPANLLLDENGDLWVTDFGLAQVHTDTRLTLTGDLIGTLRYMSPEQALAKRVIVDHRTDIYSLGATFYELATLKPVFPGQDRQELLRQIAFEEPLAPRRINKSIPVELETIILKAVEKNPVDRYSTAKEMADDLKRFLNDEPTRARRPTLWHRGRKFARRHVAAVRATAVAMCVVVAVVAATAGWWLRDRATRQIETDRALTSFLQEAEQLQKARKVPEAFAKVKQAQALLTGGTGTPALIERVNGRFLELDVVMELEEIRSLEAVGTDEDGRFEHSKTSRKYADAFGRLDLQVEALPAEEAAKRIRDLNVAVELAAALDAWASTARKINEPLSKHLLAVARAADPDPVRTQFRDALIQGNTEAIKALAASLQADEMPPATVAGVARALRDHKCTTEAVLLLRKCQTRYPGDFWLNYELGKILRYDLVNPPSDEIIRFFAAALAARPDSALGYYALADALQHKGGRQDEALANYREALRVKPDFQQARIAIDNSTGTLTPKGSPNEKIAAYLKQLAVNPDNAAVRINLGYAYRENGQFDEAIAQLKNAIDIKGWSSNTYAIAYYNLGAVELMRKVDLNAAITAFRASIDLKPKYEPPHRGLGHALRVQGKLEEATAAFDNYIRLSPDSAYACYDLALSLANSKDHYFRDPKTAMRFAKKAVELVPKNGDFWNILGLVHYRNGSWDEAVEALNHSLTLKAEGACMDFFPLSMAHWQLGDKEQASKWYEAGVQRMEGQQKLLDNSVLQSLRAEAAELMGLEAPVVKGKDQPDTKQ